MWPCSPSEAPNVHLAQLAQALMGPSEPSELGAGRQVCATVHMAWGSECVCWDTVCGEGCMREQQCCASQLCVCRI